MMQDFLQAIAIMATMEFMMPTRFYLEEGTG